MSDTQDRSTVTDWEQFSTVERSKARTAGSNTMMTNQSEREKSNDQQSNSFVAEASLSYLMDSPYLSKLILSGLGLVDVCKFRLANVMTNRTVTKLLNDLPSMVIIGGLEIELDNEDVKYPATISPGVHAFSLAKMQWCTLPSIPTPRFSAAVCNLSDGQIFVAGGIFELGNNAVANPSVFVEFGSSMIAQPAREAGTRMWRGRNAQRGTKSDAVEMFDAISGEWRSLPPLPRPRAGARACVDASGGRILVVGGSTDQREFSRDVEVFDLATNTWLTPTSSRISPMNQARTEFAMTRIPEKGILVVGGTIRGIHCLVQGFCPNMHKTVDALMGCNEQDHRRTSCDVQASSPQSDIFCRSSFSTCMHRTS